MDCESIPSRCDPGPAASCPIDPLCAIGVDLLLVLNQNDAPGVIVDDIGAWIALCFLGRDLGVEIVLAVFRFPTVFPTPCRPCHNLRMNQPDPVSAVSRPIGGTPLVTPMVPGATGGYFSRAYSGYRLRRAVKVCTEMKGYTRQGGRPSEIPFFCRVRVKTTENKTTICWQVDTRKAR